MIAVALTVGLTAWVTVILNRAAALTKVSVNANRIELRVNKLYAWMGWGSCLFALAFTLATIGDPDPDLYILTPMMWLLFGGIGIAMLLNYYRHRVSWDENQLIIVPWRKQEVRLSWQSIEQVKYVKSLSQLQLRSDGRWHQMSVNFVGLKRLMVELEQKTGLKTDKLGLSF